LAAYMIVFAKIHDRDAFIRNYAVPTAQLLAKMGGEYVLRAPGVTALEGGLFEGTSAVISKWPDRAALDAFYTAPEYQVLKAERAKTSDAHIMVVEDPA
jgi:uncharacterized protein (DUF1330 family)